MDDIEKKTGQGADLFLFRERPLAERPSAGVIGASRSDRLQQPKAAVAKRGPRSCTCL
jgi:hypothetical protein